MYVSADHGCISLVLFTVVSQKHRCLYDDIDYNQHMVSNIQYSNVMVT